MTNQLKLAEHISLTEIDDQAVLLDLNSGSYYGLNHIGVHLMKALEKGQNNDSTISEIADIYNVPRETVRTDVNALLAEMQGNNLLVETGE